MTEVPGGPGTPSAPGRPALPGGPCREEKNGMGGSTDHVSAINQQTDSQEQNCGIYTCKNI